MLTMIAVALASVSWSHKYVPRLANTPESSSARTSSASSLLPHTSCSLVRLCTMSLPLRFSHADTICARARRGARGREQARVREEKMKTARRKGAVSARR